MTKPPTTVRSIRLSDELWEQLARRAKETGLSVNALVAVGAKMATTVLVHRSDLEAEKAHRPRLRKIASRLKGEWKAP